MTKVPSDAVRKRIDLFKVGVQCLLGRGPRANSSDRKGNDGKMMGKFDEFGEIWHVQKMAIMSLSYKEASRATKAGYSRELSSVISSN